VSSKLWVPRETDQPANATDVHPIITAIVRPTKVTVDSLTFLGGWIHSAGGCALGRIETTNPFFELLSVTENHLMEIYDLPFVVIGSP